MLDTEKVLATKARILVYAGDINWLTTGTAN